MNACHPKKYALPGFDSRQAERTTQRHPPLLLAPNSVRLNFCMVAELSDATVRDG